VRSSVRRLIKQLSSPTEDTIEPAVLTASLVLEQNHLEWSAEQVGKNSKLAPDVAYAEQRKAEIREEFAHYAKGDMLPADLVDQRLNEHEVSAVASALIEILKRGGAVAAGAAAALSHCGQTAIVRPLTVAVRERLGVDDDVVREAAGAIGTLLIPIASRMRRSQEETESLQLGIESLEYAATHTSTSALTRETVKQELEHLRSLPTSMP
jgi:hypothetical protein